MTKGPFNIVNGTIVPAHFPKEFTPEELHKLGFNAAITLAWFTIIGIFALILRTRDWRKVRKAVFSALTLSPGLTFRVPVLFYLSEHCVVHDRRYRRLWNLLSIWAS